MDSGDQHKVNVLRLRILSGKLFALLETYSSGYIYWGKELNEIVTLYVKLLRLINKELLKEDLSEYRTYFKLLPQEEESDMINRVWPVSRSKFIDLLNITEAAWKTAGSKSLEKTFKLDASTSKLLDEVDDTVARYSKQIKEQIKLDELRQSNAGDIDHLLAVWPRPAKKSSSDNLKLESGSYDAANGILNFYGQQISIIKQRNMRGAAHEKNPAKLMRELFAVNSFGNGVPIRNIFPVKGDVYPPEIIKRANKLVAQINTAIQEKAPAKKVINHDKFKFYIENYYL